MTYEEALNFNQKWTEEQAFNDLERYLLRGELPAMKAVAVCMRAAKKQIPKKPIKNEWSNICPTCSQEQIDEAEGVNIYYPNCFNCGQRLDWRK